MICNLLMWSGAGLNRRHQDFQSCALPTELPLHFLKRRKYINYNLFTKPLFYFSSFIWATKGFTVALIPLKW